MSQYQDQIDALFTAELQFRLATAVRLASTVGKQPLDVPVDWSHGQYRVRYQEIALRPDQGEYAAAALQRSATYMLAMTAKDAIRVAVPDPKNSTDSSIRAAYQVARLIRNAFAHAPFGPVRPSLPPRHNPPFLVPGTLKLHTTAR